LVRKTDLVPSGQEELGVVAKVRENVGVTEVGPRNEEEAGCIPGGAPSSCAISGESRREASPVGVELSTSGVRARIAGLAGGGRKGKNRSRRARNRY